MDSIAALDQMLDELTPFASKTTTAKTSTSVPSFGETESKDGAGSGRTSARSGISGHVATSNSSRVQSKKVGHTSNFENEGANSTAVEETNPSYVKTENLDGIVVRRVPLAEPDFDTGEIKKLMEYQVENTRDNTARLVLQFEGTNFKLTPMGLASLLGANSVTMMLAPGWCGSVATCAPLVSKDIYSFKMDMKVTPIEVKEELTEELQGVFFSRVVTHDDLTYVDFRIKNTRNFAIEVGINVVGSFNSRGFISKMVVQPGCSVSCGGVSNDGDVSTSWHWKGLERVDSKGNVAKPVDENDYTETELKGVFMGRVVFPGQDGGPGKVRFRIRNTRDQNVDVDITVAGDIVGDGELKKTILPGCTTPIGEVGVRGQMDIKWKWKAA